MFRHRHLRRAQRPPEDLHGGPAGTTHGAVPGAHRQCELVNPAGIALGFDKGPIFNRAVKEQAIQLYKGTGWCSTPTGGRGHDEKHEEFGDERFYKWVQANARIKSRDFVRALLRELDDHRGRADQHDDITVVTSWSSDGPGRADDSPGAGCAQRHEYLVQVRQEVTKVVEQSAFSERDRKLIIVAVDEAVTNIMEHAYDNDWRGTRRRADPGVRQHRFEVIIRTAARSSTASLEVVNVPEHVRKGSRHGLGIFLIRQIMDEINYNFVQGLRTSCR